DEIEGTPTMFVDGKATPSMGGFRQHAKQRYETLRELLDKNVEEAAEGKIKLQVSRKGDTIDVNADVADLKETGAKIKLRIALVEDEIRYVGGNQLRLHHHVVRALMGGPEGFAVEKKSGGHKASVNLGDLRAKLTKYMASKGPYANADRPLDLKHL